MGVRHSRWLWAARWLIGSLVAVLALSSCTITLFEEDDHSDHDHTHEEDGEAAGIDHHGNPIYDEEERVYEVASATGVSVEFTMENFLGVGGRGGELAPRLIAGQHAVLQFHVTDPGSGEPISGLHPAVWLDSALGDGQCDTRIEGYLSGAVDRRPLVDLNSYFILGMNRDTTISVIDPMVDVAGMTNLYSVILLQSTAEDWAMAPGAARMFVTLPEVSRLAVVDLDGFVVEDSVELPGRPVDVAIEPSGKAVWVTLDDGAGLAVVDVESLQIELIATGRGGGPLAFSGDGRLAVVGGDGAVDILETSGLRTIAEIPLLGASVAAAVSPLSGQALVVDDSGFVSVLDLGTGQELARVALDQGVADLDVSPDGRWAVAVNPILERAYVFDVAGGRVTHVVPVKGVPDQVAFTEEAAYIHTSGSPSVTVIPLAEIDPAGDVSVLTVPIGNSPSGTAGLTAGADSIMPTPDGDAVLIANPADDQIYFYTEGAQSALGGFQGHTLAPRAVEVVDRTLKEPSPGVYTGSIRIPAEGEFSVAFWLDDPSLTHCFTFAAKPADDDSAISVELVPEVEVLSPGTLSQGVEQVVTLRLTDSTTGEVIEGRTDLMVALVQTSGSWSDRLTATPMDDGTYAIRMAPPSAGLYSMLLAIPSDGLDFSAFRPVSLRVEG